MQKSSGFCKINKKIRINSKKHIDKWLQKCYNVFRSKRKGALMRPPNEYTNQEWQSDFEILKQTVTPAPENRMTVVPDTSSYGSYHGKTQYQNYCSFINNILKNIRRGEIDYCYYIYQIADLLKYEKERLEVQWLQLERCFRISLK